MKTSTKLMIIAVVIAIATTVAEIGFIVAGNGLGAGVCLVAELFVGGMFRFASEMTEIGEGNDNKAINQAKVIKVSSHDICVVCGEHVPEGRQICTMCETGTQKLNTKFKPKN